jgi:hypothetical protein
MVVVAWILLAPSAVACAVGCSRLANRFVARHLGVARALGWIGLAMLLAGSFSGLSAAHLALIGGAPLAGLAVWSHASPGDDGDDPPDDPLPPAPEIDWDTFMRDLQRWSDMPRPRG